MRALAVVMVVGYHLFPGVVPGGFVGVDVFLVISGFLITRHLLQRPPRGVHDLLAFWVRRIRRLLPAGLVVLAATLLVTWWVLPEILWRGTAQHSLLAALNLVNWQLASESVDYFSDSHLPTGVQHYWSLSVEEQFYLVWPLLVLAVAAVASRRRVPLPALFATVSALVVAASLWASISMTAQSPEEAYFVTTTRLWELGAGALVACWTLGAAPRPRWWSRRGTRLALAWGGLAATVAAAVLFDSTTPFPGIAALLPVLGAAAVIVADSDDLSGGPVRFCSRPVRWIGDHSYSIYLWHWPVHIVLGGGVEREWPGRAVVTLALTLALSALSKRFVEDVFRRPRNPAEPVGGVLAVFVSVAAVVFASAALAGHASTEQDRGTASFDALRASGAACLGAAAITDPETCPEVEPTLVTAPSFAAGDTAEAEESALAGRPCRSAEPASPVRACTFGDGKTEVALFGNSYAGHWSPALIDIAERRDWTLTLHSAYTCPFGGVPLESSEYPWVKDCDGWHDEVMQRLLADPPDLVIVANRIVLPAAGLTYDESIPVHEQAYEETIRSLVRAGSRVLVLGRTTTPGAAGVTSVPTCLLRHGTHAPQCSGDRDTWLKPQVDPLITAARRVGEEKVSWVDPVNWFCRDETCPAVIGGVVVHHDGSHLTRSYALTLAQPLEEAMERVGALG